MAVTLWQQFSIIIIINELLIFTEFSIKFNRKRVQMAIIHMTVHMLRMHCTYILYAVHIVSCIIQNSTLEAILIVTYKK